MKKTSSFVLLFLRGLPLLFRPLTIFLEGFFLTNEFLLVTVIPLVTLVLMISSLPVYVDFYKNFNIGIDEHRTGSDYVSALLIVTLLTCCFFAFFIFLGSKENSLIFIISAVAFYISEKLIDELSRRVEFQKKFGNWFLIQLFRSAWLIIPITLAMVGYSYQNSFLVIVILIATISVGLFRSQFSYNIVISFSIFRLIKEKILFVFGAALPAIYRQGPRILVPILFPNIAHTYVAVAQLCQALSLAFDVKFIIPYRKISARHPRLYFKRMKPVTSLITIVAVMVAVLYLAISFKIDIDAANRLYLMFLLVPILGLEAIVISVVLVNSGLLLWFTKQVHAMQTFSVCIAFYSVILLAVYCVYPKLLLHSVIAIPAMNILLGLMWRMLMIKRHFT